MAAITICIDFGAQKNKVSPCFHYFPIYLPWSDGTRCHDLSFLNVEFKPTFSLSLTFIKRRFSSSSLSAIRVVSYAYLRSLIFLSAILIPACVCYLFIFLSPQGPLLKDRTIFLSAVGSLACPIFTPLPVDTTEGTTEDPSLSSPPTLSSSPSGSS